MLLKEICNIKIGSIVNRYQSDTGAQYKIVKRSAIIRNEAYFNHESAEHVYVDKTKISPLLKDDVVVFLHGELLAITIEDCNNVIVPSSFAILNGINQQLADKWYLVYYINKFQYTKDFFEEYSIMGTSMRVMKISSLKNLYVNLPDIEVQKYIGEYYKRICDKRKFNRQLIESQCDIDEFELAGIVADILKEAY